MPIANVTKTQGYCGVGLGHIGRLRIVREAAYEEYHGLVDQDVELEAWADSDGGLDVELAADDLAADGHRLLSGGIAEVLGETVVVAVADQIGTGSDQGGKQYSAEQTTAVVVDLISEPFNMRQGCLKTPHTFWCSRRARSTLPSNSSTQACQQAKPPSVSALDDQLSTASHKI